MTRHPVVGTLWMVLLFAWWVSITHGIAVLLGGA